MNVSQVEETTCPVSDSLIARRTGPKENHSSQQLQVPRILRGAAEHGVYRERFLTPVAADGVFRFILTHECANPTKRRHPRKKAVQQPLPSSGDWYRDATGRERPNTELSGLPLFGGAEGAR